jgi:hypothetical protein
MEKKIQRNLEFANNLNKKNSQLLDIISKRDIDTNRQSIKLKNKLNQINFFNKRCSRNSCKIKGNSINLLDSFCKNNKEKIEGIIKDSLEDCKEIEQGKIQKRSFNKEKSIYLLNHRIYQKRL